MYYPVTFISSSRSQPAGFIVRLLRRGLKGDALAIIPTGVVRCSVPAQEHARHICEQMSLEVTETLS